MDRSLVGLFRNRDFALFWGGVVASEIGLRGTFAACIALAQAPSLLLAAAAAISIGGTDAMASVVRDAAVQLETRIGSVAA